MTFLRDCSFSAITAGFVAVLVVFTSTVVIVFQAAGAVGANEAEIASWIWALGIGLATTSVGLSLCYRVPILTAWSTPGAAMLITGAAGIPISEAIGAFLICALLIMLFGFTGWFERVIGYVPMALASGMLAGVLLRFGLDVFVALQHHFLLVAVMLGTWLLARRWLARYAVMLALVAGISVAKLQGQLHFNGFHFAITHPVFILPNFSVAALIGVALPLFVITMISQNVTGVAVLRTHGYGDTPVSPLIGWTGMATLLLAPFGAFAINLAATAAICTSHEAHEDHRRRYVAAVAAGFFYLLAGLFSSMVTALFGAFPKELVLAIAGIALFGTIGNGLTAALLKEQHREAALITFLVTASGLSLLGIGSAFWGLIAGLAVLGGQRRLKNSPRTG